MVKFRFLKWFNNWFRIFDREVVLPLLFFGAVVLCVTWFFRNMIWG